MLANTNGLPREVENAAVRAVHSAHNRRVVLVALLVPVVAVAAMIMVPSAMLIGSGAASLLWALGLLIPRQRR